MNNKWDRETRTYGLIVVPPGEPIYSDYATRVYLEDEAAGEFVVVEQNTDLYTKIAIGPDEWPALRAAIDKMITDCRKDGLPDENSESHPPEESVPAAARAVDRVEGHGPAGW